MTILTNLLAQIAPALPMGVTAFILIVVFFALQKYFKSRETAKSTLALKRQLTMLLATLVGLLFLIMTSPLNDSQKGSLLGLLGLLLSGALALSATTILGNALAGIMLRTVNNFRMGDFIRVGDHFGRVSERGLFHTEIQTEERDLTTLPNLYLATRPVKVKRTSGTIVTAEVSLGYEVSHARVKKLLFEATEAAGLKEGYVHIIELGDFSILYRACGMLTEVKQLISSRSRLRESMLDALHENGVEIVSPNFMNTRAITEGREFIPRPEAKEKILPPTGGTSPDHIAFDKADDAESAETLQLRVEEMGAKILTLQADKKSAATEQQKERISQEIEKLERIRERVQAVLKAKIEKIED